MQQSIDTISLNNKRIAKNTLLLYVRMLFTMLVSLYTSRVVLNTLGVEDFGIYNVVGGIVAMFSILSGSLSAAIQRFITFELGKEDRSKLKSIFSTAVTIQIFLALLIIVLAETIGLWFLNNRINVSVERMIAANWVFQFSIITFAINLISIPYNAIIIAHERMKVFAYIGVLDVFLKLLVVFLLVRSPMDKLVFYSLLLMLVALFIMVVYRYYCKRNFEDCNCKFVWDKLLLKEMISFSGWNFIGASSAVLRDQGVNIILNVFCGTVINAARGIAFQVSTTLQGFISNFMMALNPQITKSYASGEREYMMFLIFQGARFSFYMLFLLSLPIIIEAENILLIWLKNVPEHTVNFVRLILLFSMSESISTPLITAMLATGKIKKYQLIVGGLQMANFPISYLLLQEGLFPEITMIVAIAISQCCLIARLYLLRSMIGLSVRQYLKKVYLNTVLVGVLSALLPIWIYNQISNEVFRGILVFCSSVSCTLVVVFYVGCNSKERIFILQRMAVLKRKIKNDSNC